MSEPVIDLSPLREIGALPGRDGGTLLDELILTYLVSAAECLAQLRDAAGRGDAAGVRAAAHRLKGSAGNFRAVALSTEAGAREEATTRGLLPTPEALDALTAAAAEVERALRAQLSART